MQQITGELVLAALMENNEYASQPVSVLAAIEPFVIAMPDVLKDHLQNPVSIASIANAKIAFLQYCVENEYVKKTVAALPEEAFGWVSATSVALMMQSLLSRTMEIVKGIAANVPEFLESQNLNEEQIMASPEKIGLRPDVLDLYKAGSLTIGDLLVMQPMVIFKNS